MFSILLSLLALTNLTLAIDSKVQLARIPIIMDVFPYAYENMPCDSVLSKSNNEDAESLFNYAYCLEFGFCIQQDTLNAIELYIKSGNNGSIRAQKHLAYLFQTGLYVDKSEDKAAQWYLLAAERGDIDSQNYISNCYRFGKGLPQDDLLSEFWTKIAADNGSNTAQYLYACILKDRKLLGLSVDPSQIESYLKSAAHQGNHAAQYDLGNMYETGTVVAENLVLAYFWYSLATSFDKSAQTSVDRISRQISNSQIEAAKIMLKDWKEDFIHF